MLTIQLHKLRFFATHGLYAEENVAGTSFEIDAQIDYLPGTLPVKHIGDTVDYTRIYDTIARRMKQSEKLLETVVYNIANDIMNEFPIVQVVRISITKLHLPVINFSGNVSVTYTMNRGEEQTIS